MKRRVLILGSGGMLGRYLVRVFSDKWEVSAWDTKDCDFLKCNLEKNLPFYADVLKKVEKIRPSVIINAAAYNNVDGAEEEYSLALQINAHAVEFFSKIAHTFGARFIHYSSDYVFDGRKKQYSEDDDVNPISQYGRTKYIGEELLWLGGKQSKYYIIRTSRLFGEQGNGKRSFVDIIREKIHEGVDFDVINKEVASPTYAKDLAKMTLKMINQHKPSGVYHVTNSGSCTWYEWASEICTHLGKEGFVHPVDNEAVKRPAKRPLYSVLYSKKIAPLRSWQDALKEYLLGEKTTIYNALCTKCKKWYPFNDPIRWKEAHSYTFFNFKNIDNKNHTMEFVCTTCK